MPFYEYRQNNSGGGFDYSEWHHACYVIVEAKNAREADSIAQDHGLYFDGYGDCSCCGDRWYPKADSWGDDSGSDVPSHYGKPLTPGELGEPFLWDRRNQYVIIHYLDGRTEAWTWSEKKNKYIVKFK